MTLASLFFLMSILAASCGKDAPTNQDEKITLSFSIVGADLIETDEPFSTKGDDGEETTYAIGVWEYNTNTSQYDVYARGSFDSSENISIQVTRNKKYKIKAVLLKNYFSSGEYLIVQNSSRVLTDKVDNEFVYGSEMFRVLQEGVYPLFYHEGKNKVGQGYFPGEAFYGVVTDFVASQDSDISIDLSRISTYLSIVVNGMTEGKIISKLSADANLGLEFSFEYPNTSYETWITDSYFSYGEDSFSRNLELQYVDSQNNTKILVDQKFTFRRNYRKTITLNLTKSVPTEIKSNFTINVSNSPLLDDEDQTFNVEI